MTTTETMNVIPATNVDALVVEYHEHLTVETFGDWLKSRTPAEIDGMLAFFQRDRVMYAQQASNAFDSAAREVGKDLGLKQPGRDWRGQTVMEDAPADLDQVQAYLREHREDEASEYSRLSRVRGRMEVFYGSRENMQEMQIHIRTLVFEYNRRGGWTRAFLVNNSNGHVHSSTSCSTCFETTQYVWLTDYSGHDEAEIVGDAGERACTVCYPSAPVDVLKRATKMFTPDEVAAQAAREERAAKKAEREAATVTLEVWDSGRRFRNHDSNWMRTVTWKTVRALQNDTGSMVRKMLGDYAMVNGFDLDVTEYNGTGRVPTNREEAVHNLRVMLAALTERGVDAKALVEKNVKRATKEMGNNVDRDGRDRVAALLAEV